MTYVNLGASYDFGTNGRRELFVTVDNAVRPQAACCRRTTTRTTT
jgi:hypothetical protein